MKFFFPDSQDLVDPSFDFIKETRGEHRVRHRDDLYAHEVFKTPPYDGLLVSKAIVDGRAGAAGKYSLAQRHRLFRVGVREFFRLNEREEFRTLETMGDCGAFSYVREKEPTYSVEEVLRFYEDCQFDYGISVDHVILAYEPQADQDKGLIEPEWKLRQDMTIDLARDFLREHKKQKLRFHPMGVAQGWSPVSYAKSVRSLQKLGYERIALGGMVPLKAAEILACLKAIAEVRARGTQLHLLGVNRFEYLDRFERLGVRSFDSTSPLRQAFKDDKDNYHTADRTYIAIRVPQVEGNPKLQRLIRAGKVDNDKARRLETECLKALTKFDETGRGAASVVRKLADYDELFDGRRDKSDEYREVLDDAPWKRCACDVCREIGIHVVVFRGADRNRRRGFHNIHVLSRKLTGRTERKTATREKARAQQS